MNTSKWLSYSDAHAKHWHMLNTQKRCIRTSVSSTLIYISLLYICRTFISSIEGYKEMLKIGNVYIIWIFDFSRFCIRIWRVSTIAIFMNNCYAPCKFHIVIIDCLNCTKYKRKKINNKITILIVSLDIYCPTFIRFTMLCLYFVWGYACPCFISSKSRIIVLCKMTQNGWYVPVRAWANTWTTPVSSGPI